MRSTIITQGVIIGMNVQSTTAQPAAAMTAIDVTTTNNDPSSDPGAREMEGNGTRDRR